MTIERDRRGIFAGSKLRQTVAWTARCALGVALSMSVAPVAKAQVAVDVGVSAGAAYPSAPPPDVVPEDRPLSPGPGYYWVPGTWDWTGGDWEWMPGYWMPHRDGYAYVGPRFVWEGDRFVYYRPFWEGPRGYHEYRYGAWRGAPPVAWRAHPRYEPRAWRAEHTVAWRRGAPAGAFRAHEETRAIEAHRVAGHREAEHRAVEHHEAEHRAVQAEHHEAEHRAVEHREAAVAHHEAEHRGAPVQHAPPAHGGHDEHRR
ncbi:MAG TPA: hypothetical protein VH062_33030 [Polyangiaceae bacterium]|jgi:hypothetical protein|nr:hypothetical protein [Polyangiaceae bacterium]